MKRTDITALFPDATEEQINKLMDINGGDINKAKGELEDIKGKLTAAQGELTALKGQSKPDELKDALSKMQALQSELDGMKAAEKVRGIREKVSQETKVPVSLLTGETEEACAEQAKSILAFASDGKYPAMKDAGEVHGSNNTSTREKFAEWAKENL